MQLIKKITFNNRIEPFRSRLTLSPLLVPFVSETLLHLFRSALLDVRGGKKTTKKNVV